MFKSCDSDVSLTLAVYCYRFNLDFKNYKMVSICEDYLVFVTEIIFCYNAKYKTIRLSVGEPGGVLTSGLVIKTHRQPLYN